MMQVWSNDEYLAPEHRVKTQRDLLRCSAPFFYNPSYETTYAPVESTISESKHALYRPISWKEFRLGRFAGDYADVGKEIQISHFRYDYQGGDQTTPGESIANFGKHSKL